MFENAKEKVETSNHNGKIRVVITEGNQGRWFDVTKDTAIELIDKLWEVIDEIQENERGTN